MPQTFDQRNRDIVVGVELGQSSSSIAVMGGRTRSLRDQLVERAGAGEAVHGRSLNERFRYQRLRPLGAPVPRSAVAMSAPCLLGCRGDFKVTLVRQNDAEICLCHGPVIRMAGVDGTLERLAGTSVIAVLR